MSRKHRFGLFYLVRRSVILTLPLILFASILAGVTMLPTAHALTVVVCLTDSSAVVPVPNPCPATTYIFNRPFPSSPQPGPTQIRVGVYIQGSDGLNAFDITLLTNAATLKPAGIDLAGTVLNSAAGPATVVLECIGGNLVAGTVCSLTTDTAGTIHVAASAAPGAPLTAAPTAGVLFTAVFNITAATSSGGVAVGFQTGCSGTSVSPDTCVTIANGSITPDAETVRAATFDNSACLTNCEWYATTSTASSISVLQGATTGNTVTITATAPNGLPLLGSTSVIFSTAVSAGFTAPNFGGAPTFDCNTFTGTPLTCSTTLTVSTLASGTYFVTIYGNYIADDCLGPCSATYTLAGTVTIQVNVGGVAWTVNGVAASSPQTMYFAKGAFSIPYTFTSLGGYSGTITLTQTTCSLTPTGIVSCPTLPVSFTLNAGGSVTQQMTFTATGEGRVLYRDSMAATSLPSQSQGLLTILVSGFSIASSSSTVSFASGSSASVTVTLASLGAPTFQFAGPVAIASTTLPSTGLTVGCSPGTVSLTAGGTGTTTCTFSSAVTSTTTFTVTITGTGGTNNAITNSTAVSVTVTGLADFTISANPSTVSATVGVAATSTITISPVSGFASDVALTSDNSACTLSPSTVTGGAGTSTLSCTFAATGSVTVTVTGTSGSLSHTATVDFTVTGVQDFTISASPTSVSAVVNSPGASTITISPLNGLSGNVALTANNSACTLTPTTVTGGSGTSTLSCTFTSTGTVTVTVTGTSGSLSHTATVAYTVTPAPDFTISANPTAVDVNVNSAGTSLISISPLNGFTGAVAVTSGNAACSFTPASVSGGSGTSTLSCTFSSTGSVTVTITGTSGSLPHATTVAFTVQDFTISANPTSVSVNVNQAGASTITIAAVSGFSSPVTLSSDNAVSTLTPSCVR